MEIKGKSNATIYSNLVCSNECRIASTIYSEPVGTFRFCRRIYNLSFNITNFEWRVYQKNASEKKCLGKYYCGWIL